MTKRIPLYEVHKDLGALFGEFAGWEAPINYGSVIEEHMAVRSSVGIFDLSHMGRILVSGADSIRLLDYLVPRELGVDVGEMAGPTAFLNERAGFKDDVMLYRLSSDQWLIVCNAINIEKVLNWLEYWSAKLSLSVRVEDKTMDSVLIAIQGPDSLKALKMLKPRPDPSSLKLLKFVRDVYLEELDCKMCLISRSGWTGEDGFEIIGPLDCGEKILRYLHDKGVRLCGLAARDSLRMEMGYVLYGHEINEDITPIDARYWWVLQPGPKKGGFIGYEALMEAFKRGARMVRVGIKMAKRVRIVPRSGDKILVLDEQVGYITSGAFSPVLKRSIAQAYVKPSHALIGLRVVVEHRGKCYEGKIVEFPFVTPSSKPPV